MKDLRCILGFHKFSDWIEVENHLERECLRQRCGKIEAKYPPLSFLKAKLVLEAAKLGLKALDTWIKRRKKNERPFRV